MVYGMDQPGTVTGFLPQARLTCTASLSSITECPAARTGVTREYNWRKLFCNFSPLAESAVDMVSYYRKL